jgi:serine/threonine protein phosphatase 1
MNIIADVAGEFSALLALAERMPKGEPFVLVGDLIDRGPDSRSVVDWAINNKAIALMGNHESMMLDFFNRHPDEYLYSPSAWFQNGGLETLKSYGVEVPRRDDPLAEATDELQSHLKWLSKLPLTYKTDDLLVSHAPLAAKYETLQEALDVQDGPNAQFLWNRTEPRKREYFQVFGHCSNMGLRRFENWAICLDDSKSDRLTGFHYPSGEVYQVGI